MCFVLFLASPLTLSEVRSMLPAGLAADPLPSPDQQPLRRRHPDAQTVARLLRGGCACDLVLQRHQATRDDEARLRQRFRVLGLGRRDLLEALERHRRALERPPRPTDHWPAALAAFAVEHARNAGPTAYLLRFPDQPLASHPLPTREETVSAAGVRGAPGSWLREEVVTWVQP